jgi:Predicted membrane protein
MSSQKPSSLSLASLLTILSALIVGILDAYSTIQNEGTIMSAQTGNLVNLAVKLATGHFSGLANHFALLIGFALGCILSVFILRLFKTKKNRQMILWTVFSIFIWLIALFGSHFSEVMSIIALSFSAGMALSFFRELRSSNLNNGIMTGNLKNMYGALVDVVVYKEVQKLPEAMNLLTVIIIFFVGSLVGGLVSNVSMTAILFVAAVICLLPYIQFFVKKSK